MKLSSVPSVSRQRNDNKKSSLSLHWRQKVIRALSSEGCGDVGYKLKNCGCSFFADVCIKDLNHEPKAIPVHCGLRICPECEARESYRKVLRYLPALNEMLFENPDYPDYKLRKLVLTTPFQLLDLTSDSFKHKQTLVHQFLQAYFYPHFLARKELSKAEIRRGRVDLRQHGIGGIVAAEFGEKSQHLHWHCLVYSPFIKKEKAWEVWEQVSGGACLNLDLSAIKPQSTQMRGGGGDLLAALKEITKYATKFTAIAPQDVPHLYKVLRGNRRFRSFGTLYNIKDGNETLEHLCEQCGAERQQISITTYISRCEFHNVPPDDSVIEVVESGIALFLSREPEISSGKSDKKQPKPRDSIPER